MHRDQNAASAAVVTAALLNKYQKISSNKIAEVVATALHDVSPMPEQELYSALRPIRDFNDDINNQVIIITLINRFWSKPPKLKTPLSKLNSYSFGTTQPLLRQVDEVDDFGGKVPTPVSEIRTRLDELECLSEIIVSNLGSSPLNEKSLMLAYIYGSLIRIHPFRDGNGRTARLFAFYALTCWGMPLFPIPKVRNDSAWKKALESAIAGEIEPLKEQFICRLKAVGE